MNAYEWIGIGIGIWAVLVYLLVCVWSSLPRVTTIEDEQRMVDEYRAAHPNW